MQPHSCSRILSNLHNAARAAEIGASAQRPSEDVRQILRRKRGTGRTAVQGAYTGARDSVIEVEIVDVSGGTLTASTPAVAGVGSGTVEVGPLRATAVAETVTLTLLDAGTPDRHATFDFFGHEIAARVAGPAGNALALTVERRLVAESVGATLDTLSASATTLDGPAWDYGQPSGDGQTVPANATRIRFAGYPTVHWSWRTWDGAQWQYHLSPAAPYEVPSDTVVERISGDYVVTVSDGATTESYEAVTVYDFLRQVRVRSALLEVRAAVTLDRTPGGMAVTDIPLRTDAYALPAQVKTKVETRVRPGPVRPSALTENLSIRYLGADMWSVTGAASGEWPNAATGVPYRQGPAGFTIDKHVKPVAAALLAHMSGEYKAVTRKEGEGLPAVCLKPLRLGAKATDKTITFEYRKRPPADCPCEHLPPLAVSDVCLGLADGGHDMALDPAYQSRLTALYDWRADFFTGNVGVGDDDYARVDRSDIDIADVAARAFAQALADAYSDPAAMAEWDARFTDLKADLALYETLRSGAVTQAGTATQWVAGLPVTSGALLYPPTRNGKLYRVLADGTTGETEPDWTSAGVIEDGDTVRLQAETPYWTAGAAIAEGLTLQPGDGHRYTATVSGMTGATEPVWANGVVDGGVTWSRVTAVGKRIITGGDLYVEFGVPRVSYAWANKALPPGAPGFPNGRDAEAYASASAEYRVYAADVLISRTIVASSASDKSDNTDGVSSTARQRAAEAAEKAGNNALARIRYLLSGTTPDFERKYKAQMDHVRALAGVVPKSDASSGAGSACWRDPGGTHWWADTEGYYMPAFTNHPYVSVIKTASGEILSTQEFGFGIVMPEPCVSRLKEGDTITIKISGTGNAEEYAEDDEIIIPVVAAAPALLGGGEAGDPAQTWTVQGSASGTLPDWTLDPAAPAPYAYGPAPLTLVPGAVPFAEGDTVRFDVAGGTLRWRRDGGAWSEAEIHGEGVELGDGLLLSTRAGPAPAFVEGDTWHYRAHATYGPDRLRAPLPGEYFAWNGDTVTLDVDLGAVVTVEAVALWAVALDPAAVVTVSGGETAVDAWSEDLVRGDSDTLLAALDGPRAVRYLRVTVTGAGPLGGALGWLWAGMGWQPTVGASSITRRLRYVLARGDGLNPGGLFRGRGTGATWTWQISDGGALYERERAALVALLAHIAEQGLEPVMLVPSLKEPGLASLGILDADAIDMTDVLGWQAGEANRLVSVDLPFLGVV